MLRGKRSSAFVSLKASVREAGGMAKAGESGAEAERSGYVWDCRVL